MAVRNCQTYRSVAAIRTAVIYANRIAMGSRRADFRAIFPAGRGRMSFSLQDFQDKTDAHSRPDSTCNSSIIVKEVFLYE